jgi:hypothetical protein
MSAPSGRSSSSRCRSHLGVSRFFAVTASASSLGVARGAFVTAPEATDPLRLSAGRARPRDAASDALCRRCGATARAPALAFAAMLTACAVRGLPAAARTDPRVLARLSTLHHLPPRRLEHDGLSAQDAFRRFDPRSPRLSALRSRRTWCAPCYVRALRPAPFYPARWASPRRRRASVSRYPLPSRFASRLPSSGTGRCPSPTSATDSLHEHPWIVGFPSPTTHAVVDRQEWTRRSAPRRRRTALRRCGPEWRNA